MSKFSLRLASLLILESPSMSSLHLYLALSGSPTSLTTSVPEGRTLILLWSRERGWSSRSQVVVTDAEEADAEQAKAAVWPKKTVWSAGSASKSEIAGIEDIRIVTLGNPTHDCVSVDYTAGSMYVTYNVSKWPRNGVQKKGSRGRGTSKAH